MDNPGFQNDECGAMPRLARSPSLSPSECRVHAPAPAAPATVPALAPPAAPARSGPGYLRFGGGGAQPQAPSSPASAPAPVTAPAPSPQGHGLRELLGRLQLPAAASPDPKKAADASPLSTVSAIVAKTFPPSPLHKAAALMSQPSPRPSMDNRRNLRRSGRGAGDPLSEARLSKRRGPLGAAWKLSFAAGAGNPFHHHRHNQQAPHAAGWRNALLGAAVLIAAALASLVVAGAWLYMYTTPASHTSMGPERVFDTGEGVSVVAGEFRITNEEFVPELADPGSDDFSQLSMQICRQLDELFGRSGLSGRYNGSAVPALEAARPSGVRVRCRLLLLSPEPEPGLAGVEFLRGLRHRRGRMWLGDFTIDVQSIGFQAESESEDSPETTTDGEAQRPPAPQPQWSAWSEWSDCPPASAPSRSQSRSRLCLSAAGAPLEDIEPCLLAGGGGDLEARDCPGAGPEGRAVMAASVFEEPAPPPDEVVVMDLSAGNDARHCDECRPGEVCVALGTETLPLCRTPSDPSDPTGCGGLCQLGTEVCYKLDIDAFRCIDDSFCLPSEWQCANQLCIPEVKRCDGHMNCYDHTDEYDCECNLESNFHCGNSTSCLPTRKKCDGVIDCWDGSDELNCTIACPSPQQFTCTDGQCIPRSQFCDGYADCSDKSDEPFGCGGECKSHEWECNNGRCIMREEVCDGEDTCGDLSDEKACPQTTEDQS
ncbi:uncharacterized protein LOC126475337 [Schistocerca serialis cubense]|uniref:uncharacterized protein LOC126475337 n=1 Tax=Schistocerca serialis cubense TaxID=2023355 RepID=UPI00214E0FF0|nr:uncharacterized protein LOC126475337 [Schistocerca serialis cubense]